MNKKQNYFNYLKQRSFLGYIYRRYFLYPKLNSYLKGDVLDVGCGIGDMLAFKPSFIGADINEFNVALCKQRGLNACLMLENVLPFSNNKFDSILLDNVLEHIKDPKPLLSEIKRVMRHDGSLLIGVPGVIGFASDDDHKIFYDESKLAELAKSAGYKILLNMYMPLWRSRLFSKILKQYCVYSLWVVKD